MTDSEENAAGDLSQEPGDEEYEQADRAHSQNRHANGDDGQGRDEGPPGGRECSLSRRRIRAVLRGESQIAVPAQLVTEALLFAGRHIRSIPAFVLVVLVKALQDVRDSIGLTLSI